MKTELPTTDPAPRAERCDTCRYWMETLDSFGSCRRNPPIAIKGQCPVFNITPLHTFMGLWPHTDWNDWCGEWCQLSSVSNNNKTSMNRIGLAKLATDIARHSKTTPPSLEVIEGLVRSLDLQMRTIFQMKYALVDGPNAQSESEIAKIFKRTREIIRTRIAFALKEMAIAASL